MLSERPNGTSAGAMAEAFRRARLAVLWERLGNGEAAAREYARIGVLTGRDNPSYWRALGERSLKTWVGAAN